MSAEKAQTWMWVEENSDEDPDIRQARVHALDLGAEPISPATGATLRLLASLKDAHAVAEIGTGAGVSSMWLLSGMPTDGVLTSIDSEAEFHRVARTSLTDAGVATSRFRLINGRALDVLPRMAHDAYDIVFIDADVLELNAYITEADKMLRSGGLLILARALWKDQLADPARRDPQTVAMREALRLLRESEDYELAIIPTGDGLAVAHKA